MPRRVPVSKSLETLRPDGILISHAHMDHLSNPTLQRFPGASIILPSKSESFLLPSLLGQAIPASQGTKFGLGPLTVTPVKALHGGWRYPWQKGYKAFGYLISDQNQTIYYAGDTAYGPHFKQIGNPRTIDFALLPIGAYSPRWFLKSRHLNPLEAIQACKDLEAKTTIPFHFGSYRLALDPLHEALPWFAREADRQGIHWRLDYDFS